MFDRLGRLVGKRPGRVVASWGAVVAILFLLMPDAADLARREPKSLLPKTEPYNQALAFEREAFPQVAARTRSVLIFEASGGLTPQHTRFLQGLSRHLCDRYADRPGWFVQSPYTQPFLRSRMLSADGAAAMIVVNSDTNYLTLRAVGEVANLRDIVEASLPADLTFEVTGEGGLGYDLSLTSKEAFDRTTLVTLAALLVILGVIYRAPLAALVPLAAIGLSVVAAILLLNQTTRLGWGLSTFEKTIVVVLLFGSGTDFGLFWLASFREELVGAGSRREAAERATRRTGPAILSSAGTTIAGLLMLMSADLLPSHNSGRALAVALSVSLVGALTLIPALSLLMGSALYWPRPRLASAPRYEKGFWAWLGRAVANRPARSVALCLLVLVFPLYHGCSVHYTYDAFGIIPPHSSAARGEALARKHFSAEQLFSWTCLVTAPRIGGDVGAEAKRAEKLATVMKVAPDVADVWSLTAPLGAAERNPLAAMAMTDLGRRQALPYYLSVSSHTLRFEIMMRDQPLSESAMNSCEDTLARVRDKASQLLGADAIVRATGLTPYILNVHAVSARDHVRVVTLVIAVILIIVYVLVRDALLAVVMLLGTVGVYLVTLGTTEWFFVTFTGASGIDWKVKLFSFVILVAVGQDYNIFLVTRLLREREEFPIRQAARRAIAGTGGVISSCGAIMAATLGSLAATGLPFFQQLGFAFALGVLVDTFIIRPVFVPGVYLLLRSRASVRADSGDAG